MGIAFRLALSEEGALLDASFERHLLQYICPI